MEIDGTRQEYLVELRVSRVRTCFDGMHGLGINAGEKLSG